MGGDDVAVWEQFAALVASSNDPKLIAEACAATMGTARKDDFGMLMRARPEAIVRAAAEWLNEGVAERLLPAWGLSPEDPGSTG